MTIPRNEFSIGLKLKVKGLKLTPLTELKIKPTTIPPIVISSGIILCGISIKVATIKALTKTI
ncbi:MAG: hypothetical protein BWY16_00577 [Candidatus Omnitrophica bacterium ADurb.Bin205]|nr:MAG: hypothetical protein BWY16_00577 [Candidatus Omnitrophica bacterium ADurb.Bin205]